MPRIKGSFTASYFGRADTSTPAYTLPLITLIVKLLSSHDFISSHKLMTTGNIELILTQATLFSNERVYNVSSYYNIHTVIRCQLCV